MNDFIILGSGLAKELPANFAGAVPNNRAEFIMELRQSPWAMGIVPVLSIANGRATANAVRSAGVKNLLLGMMRPCGTHEWKAAFLNYGGDQIIPRDTPHELLNGFIDALMRRDRTVHRKIIEFAGFRYSFECGRLDFDGERINLSPTEQRLVTAIITGGGNPIHMERLKDALDTTEGCVRQLLAKSRKKILAASGGVDFILSHWGDGYTFLPTGFRPGSTVGTDGKGYRRSGLSSDILEAAE